MSDRKKPVGKRNTGSLFSYLITGRLDKVPLLPPLSLTLDFLSQSLSPHDTHEAAAVPLKGSSLGDAEAHDLGSKIGAVGPAPS